MKEIHEKDLSITDAGASEAGLDTEDTDALLFVKDRKDM